MNPKLTPYRIPCITVSKDSLIHTRIDGNAKDIERTAVLDFTGKHMGVDAETPLKYKSQKSQRSAA